MYKFNKEDIKSFEFADEKNYVLANGIGGMSSMSIINSSSRKHFGYLVAAKKAPVDRVMILNKINETVVINDNIYSFEAQKYDNEIKDGYKYLKSFSFEYAPRYEYFCNGVKVIKSISLMYLKNEVAITYEIISSVDAKIILEPIFNYRNFNEASKKEDLRFIKSIKDNTLTLNILNDNINFYVSEGKYNHNLDTYTNGYYNEYDISTGDERLDYNYKPVNIEIDILKNDTKKISVICALGDILEYDAFKVVEDSKIRLEGVVINSKLEGDFLKELVVSSDAFISKRDSTKLTTILAGLPWFTDWGRDTMIAFTGITLVTKRFDIAKEILKSFSLYENNGLIPNMFPDDGAKPLYNTVDASLWYFYACYKYVSYTNDYDFILNEIYDVLKNIIKYYKAGTDFSIYMDNDFLIHAGDDEDQVTWMDVRTHGKAVTPRHGKPVEINALWYNALMVMDHFTKHFNICDNTYYELALKVRKSFNEKFYNEKLKCLYDTIDPYDDSIRPNQIYAVSLPFRVLDEIYCKDVFDRVKAHLYNRYGLRSLSNLDKRFKPKYEGSLDNRDYAYHMGTTWGFLIGGYIDACYIVYKDKNMVLDIINEFKSHLNEGCLGGVAEIFDGDYASRSRGCYSQAWSVGELLRAYYENIIK